MKRDKTRQFISFLSAYNAVSDYGDSALTNQSEDITPLRSVSPPLLTTKTNSPMVPLMDSQFH